MRENRFELITEDVKIKAGVEVLSEYYPFFKKREGKLYAVKTECNPGIEKDGEKTVIRYSDLPSFYYAFSYFISGSGEEKFSYEFFPRVKRMGFMRDCARNGAINLKAFKELTVCLALAGYSYIELYTEDLMKIEGLDYLGADRPAYSIGDIVEMEDFCKIFGIELVPCIQTLAHLPAMFKHDVFNDIHDNETVLLADEEKTYEFLDKVINWVAKAFSSRRINIGMDEAYRMCIGKYADKFGYPDDKGKVFLRHLYRVLGICEKYGFKAHAFSDMFFRCGLKHEKGCSYENIGNRNFTREFAAAVPKNLTLVFWDYNHDDEEFYDSVFTRHRQLSDDISYACGVWSWKGFAPFNTIGEKNSIAALKCSQKYGVKDFLVTFWGDNGAECSVFSVLSTIYALADENYLGNTERGHLNERMEALFGNSYDEFKNLENANVTEQGTVKDGIDINPSKYLLYGDSLLGTFDYYCRPEMEKFFRRNAEELESYGEKNGRFKFLFETLAKLCRVLEIKSTLGLKMTEAYKTKDKCALKSIATRLIPECCKRLKNFYAAFTEQWKKENRLSGLEVGDIRLGGLILRLEETAEILSDYVSGKINRIEELEGNRLAFYVNKKGKDTVNNAYVSQISGSVL